MIEGIYRFYANGECVGEGKNLITTTGKKAIIRYLAGQIPEFGGGLVVGTVNTAAGVGDANLYFEVARVPVDLKAVKDYSTFDIVFRGSLPKGLAAKITECGLVVDSANTANRGVSNRVFALMESTGEGWAVANGPAIAADATNVRLGADAIKINSIPANNTSILTLNGVWDLSKYVATDKFALQFGTFDTNCASVKLEFINSAGYSLYYTYTPATHTAGAGVFQAQLLTQNMSVFTNWVNDWTNVTQIKITTTAGAGGTCSVALDGISVMDANISDELSALVSRAVVTAIPKVANIDMDIEYTMRFSL